MKIIDILNARNSIAMLNRIKFADFKMVSNVYRFTKRINEVLEMHQQEQKKIIDIYVLKDEKGQLVIKNNQYQFADEKVKQKFIEDMNSLALSEVPDLDRIDISLDSVQAAEGFTSEELLKLEPLINWI